MKDNKMSDEQIIKALEICSDKLIISCPDDCPFYDECEKDLYVLKRQALALINHLKAQNKEFDEKIIMQMGLIEHQKAEIERLNAKIERLMKEQVEKELFEGNHYSFHNGKLCAIPKTEEKQIKSYAYKEYVERLKERFSKEDYMLCYYEENTIDNLLKELTEGGNEDGMD